MSSSKNYMTNDEIDNHNRVNKRYFFYTYTRIHESLYKEQMSLMHPNLGPFSDVNDALARLIPFHLLQNQHPLEPEKIQDEKAEEILDKYSNILDKYSDLLEIMKSDIVYTGKKKVYNILSPPPDRSSIRVQSKMSHGPNNYNGVQNLL